MNLGVVTASIVSPGRSTDAKTGFRVEDPKVPGVVGQAHRLSRRYPVVAAFLDDYAFAVRGDQIGIGHAAQGFEMLSRNSPGGVAQFFDRDAPAEMAAVAMEGFQEFMVFPDNLDDILERIESARQDIY